MLRRPFVLPVIAALLASAVAPAEGKVYLTQPEALKEAFPDRATVERRNLFLGGAQARAAAKESGEEIPPGVVTYYVGRGASGVLGYAYFDAHLVRTLPETIMVLVKPDGTLGKIVILSFAEPEDYLPRPAWLDQFPGRRLDADLALRRGVRNFTGASLTATAITSACRRVLAIHHQVKQEPH